MTREEAKDILKEVKQFNDSIYLYNIKYLEALNVAIKALDQEPFKPMVEIDLYSVIKQKYIEREVLDKVRDEIIKYEGDCRLSEDEYPSCKQCTDNVFETIYEILDKYKESEE